MFNIKYVYLQLLLLIIYSFFFFKKIRIPQLHILIYLYLKGKIRAYYVSSLVKDTSKKYSNTNTHIYTYIKIKYITMAVVL